MDKRITKKSLKNDEKFLKQLASVIASESHRELIRDLSEIQSLLRLHPLLIEDEFHMDNLATTLLRLEECFRMLKPE